MTSYKREDLRQVTFSDLSPQCNEAIIHELCVQFGPIRDLYWPSSNHHASGGGAQPPQRGSYCRVTFECLEDAKYCYAALSRYPTRIFERELRVSHGTSETRRMQSSVPAGARFALHEVGAKVTLRNVDPTVTLYELEAFFGAFGEFAVQPRMLRDSVGRFRGIVVLSYRDFASSDRVIAQMDGAVYRDRRVGAAYTLLEDGSGRPHGSAEERAMAELIRAQEAQYEARLRAEAEEAWARQRAAGGGAASWADPHAQLYAQNR